MRSVAEDVVMALLVTVATSAIWACGAVFAMFSSATAFIALPVCVVAPYVAALICGGQPVGPRSPRPGVVWGGIVITVGCLTLVFTALDIPLAAHEAFTSMTSVGVLLAAFVGAVFACLLERRQRQSMQA